MTNLRRKNRVFKTALKTAEPATVSPPVPAPSGPVVGLAYPRHGEGTLTERIIRVVEADHLSIRGFEIDNAFSNDIGQFKTFLRSKIAGPVELLHLIPKDG